MIVNQIINSDKSLSKFSDRENTIKDLSGTLSTVIGNIPRYLVEIKPMMGELFRKYLKSYSHWTYSDPDIIWGDLNGWVEKSDLSTYDIVTFGKPMDAGRLFLRGQFSVHKNIEKVNTVWRELGYLKFMSFLNRISSALKDIKTKRYKSEEIFQRHFFSAEGAYSVSIFDKNRYPKISVKICSRSFDDFSQLPAISVDNKLFRCTTYNITACVEDMRNSEDITKSVYDLQSPKFIPVKSYFNDNICRMQWLPLKTRQCIATESFRKDNLRGNNRNIEDKNLRLLRVSESVFEDGQWSINDEKVVRRGVYVHIGAYFHFRHWDDVVSRGVFTQFPVEGDSNPLNKNCMVLRIRVDNTLAYETCASAIEFDKIEWKGIEQFQAATRKEVIEKMLTKIRRTKEGGKDVKKKKDLLSSSGSDIRKGESPSGKLERRKSGGRKKISIH